jgi:hypothetical protein
MVSRGNHQAEYTSVNLHPVDRTLTECLNTCVTIFGNNQKHLRLKYGLSLLKIHEKYQNYIFRIIFYVSLIKNDPKKKEKKLTFSTKSKEQEVNLVWPNLCIF